MGCLGNMFGQDTIGGSNDDRFVVNEQPSQMYGRHQIIGDNTIGKKHIETILTTKVQLSRTALEIGPTVEHPSLKPVLGGIVGTDQLGALRVLAWYNADLGQTQTTA